MFGRDGDTLSKNRYIYVKNNPLKYVDPTGEEEIKVYIEESNIREDGHKSAFGHSFVVTNEIVYSWYNPNAEAFIDEILTDELLEDLQATPLRKYLSQSNKDTDKFHIYDFIISKKDKQNIINFYTELAKKNKVNYDDYDDRILFNLFFYNCADVVVEALRAGNIVNKNFEAKNFEIFSTPANLKRQLDIKYKSQSDPPSWYEFYDKSVIKKFNYDISKYYTYEN
ncbi:MAG: hypothetical protein ABII02_02125 [Candidatus Magasanikbacteria bacterium]